MYSVIVSLAVIFVFTSYAACEVFFEETFEDDTWKDTWVYSKRSGKEFGRFILTPGSFFNNADTDKGLQTSEDARFYALSRKFPPFSTEEKPFIFQFSVKHEQNIDCGGGYVKLFDCSLDQADMHGESPYEIMFGPDICGPGTKRVHVILSYKGKNHLINKEIRCKDDIFTHVYTLILKPDNKYTVLIDNEEVESGSLEDDWDFLSPKKIKDPNAAKPEDWDERPTIPDPNDKKPDDWEKPQHIPDPDASKPEDWDDEMDGEWEPPMIDNPDYKGAWTPKQLENPNYKGVWEHPEIDNPEYVDDPNLYIRKEICIIGLDLWQVKSGTIFDNILLTDDIDFASKTAAKVKKTQEGERKMKEKQEEEQKEQNDKSDTEDKDSIPDQYDDHSSEHDEL